MKKKFRISLRLQFSALLALLIGLIMFIVGSQVLNEERTTLIKELKEKGASWAKNFAGASAEALQTGDDLALGNAVKEMMKNEGVVYAIIVDNSGTIKAHNSIEEWGKPYQVPEGLQSLKDENLLIQPYIQNKQEVYNIAVPIFTRAGKTGTAHLGLSQESINKVVNSARQRMGLITGGGILLGIIGSIILVSFIVRPIKSLVQGVRAIGNRQFQHRIQIKSRNELGELTDAFNEMATSLEEKEKIRRAFERYVSDEVVEEALKGDGLVLGGERKKATVLFADIRDFTPMLGKIKPREAVDILNEYFTAMTPIIQKNRGLVSKFIGDAIMCIFGAPVTHPDDAFQAVKTAVDMQEKLKKLQTKWTSENKTLIYIGVGINTGDVIVGNVGSPERMEYTVIGDVVNMADRIEKLNKELGSKILISDTTYEEVKDRVIVNKLEPMKVKGKEELIQVYEVVGIKD